MDADSDEEMASMDPFRSEMVLGPATEDTRLYDDPSDMPNDSTSHEAHNSHPVTAPYDTYARSASGD